MSQVNFQGERKLGVSSLTKLINEQKQKPSSPLSSQIETSDSSLHMNSYNGTITTAISVGTSPDDDDNTYDPRSHKSGKRDHQSTILIHDPAVTDNVIILDESNGLIKEDKSNFDIKDTTTNQPRPISGIPVNNDISNQSFTSFQNYIRIIV